tara:strand:- start:2077 stop:2895 length:819 start_codon:yes stop_codon:yes gene_type:complete
MENCWVLVDLGYMCFLRYHATKIWFKWQPEKDQENPWQNEEVFRNTLLRVYERTLKKLTKKKKAILAMESLDGGNWRKQIYSEYKGTRPKNYDIFEYLKFLANDWLPKFCENNENCIYYKIPNTEADDIIALKAHELLKQDPVPEISIITADHDFIQLVEKDNNIRMYNDKYKLNKKCEEDLVGFAYLKRKIVYGDNSDNIKSIYSGKGCTLKKEALLEKLKNVEDLDLVTQEMVGSLKEYDKFKMNRELIDFKKIPMKTRLAFEEYSQNRC